MSDKELDIPTAQRDVAEATFAFLDTEGVPLRDLITAADRLARVPTLDATECKEIGAFLEESVSPEEMFLLTGDVQDVVFQSALQDTVYAVADTLNLCAHLPDRESAVMSADQLNELTRRLAAQHEYVIILNDLLHRRLGDLEGVRQ